MAAWEELHAAFKKLWALSSYRVRVTSSYAVTVMEIVQRDSDHSAYHSVSRITSGTSVQTEEFIDVNGQIRKRTIGVPGVPAEWQCSNRRTRSPQSGGLLVFDPFDRTASNGTLDVSRGPGTIVDGTPARTYQYIFTESDAQSGQTWRTKISGPQNRSNRHYRGRQLSVPTRGAVGLRPSHLPAQLSELAVFIRSEP